MSSGNIILFKFTSDEHLYIKQKEPIRSKEFNILAMGTVCGCKYKHAKLKTICI